jgi:L-amino acid N-acyltransferase YncA
MNFTIRHAGIEDAASIASVHVESWKTTYAGIVPADYLASLSSAGRTESWREQLQQATALILVAEDATGVIGFACGGKLREPIDGFDAELYAIYLLHQQQKQGVGRMLTRKLAQDLRRQGFKSLVVWVLARNPAAGFYARLGGSPVAEKEIEIGGAWLTEIAFAWTNLDDLI